MKDLVFSKHESNNRENAGLGKIVINMGNMRVKHFVVSFLLLLFLATICSNSLTAAHYQDQITLFGKKHFVLVHGAGHGAWCWYKVEALLNSAGHDVTSLDLAASGINPIQVEQVHLFSEYVEPLITFLGSLPPNERVILVGHSLGGAMISIAMERFPEKIAAAVYAAAVMPGPSLSFLAIRDRLLETWERVKPSRPTTIYQLSPPEDLTLALSLVRPAPAFDEDIKLTGEKYGLVPRVFIMCDQDLTIEEDVRVWMVKENPPNEVKLINGSDHMVMFSRPLELFSHLQNIAEKYS